MGEKELKVWKLVVYALIAMEGVFFIASVIEGQFKLALMDGVIIINACMLLVNINRSVELLKRELALESLMKHNLEPVLKKVAESMVNPEFFKGGEPKVIEVHVKEGEE